MAHFVYPAANPQPAAAYPAVQTAYVAAAPQAAYATAAPRAGQAYDSYQTAHATPQYAYTTRTQVAVTPAATYDQKAYYQPAAAAQAAVAYTVAETHYQAVPCFSANKPTYTSGAYQSAQRAVVTPKSHTPVQASSAATYVYPANTSQPVSTYSTTTYATNTTASATYTGKASTGASNYTAYKQTVQPVVIKGYDAALYSAATSYYQQQQQAAKTTNTWQVKKAGQTGKAKPKIPPKQPQLHYCDVCKISCAGPQTYREHLEGQKHKKKEAAMKAGTASSSSGRGSQNQLRCELCDVTCTGADAYAAHIRGSKHQKVLKLHTRLGKPIPSTDPVVVSPAASGASSVAKTASNTSTSTASVTKPTVKSNITPIATTKKVLSTPKITFIGGTQLKTLDVKTVEVKVEPTSSKAGESLNTSAASTSSNDDKDDDGDPLNILGEKDVTPVGHEYIEEVRNDQGKTVSFNCKLCECKFNDPNAKEMHSLSAMHLKTVSALLVVVFILLSETDAWWVFGGGDSDQCPRRGGASPYYFGTTNLFCMAGKRGAPARGTWALSHRFIYYKGYYFEFLDDSKAHISTRRQAGSRCSGGRESSPAGYSELSLDCIRKCARNYKCHFGSYSLLGNNCHKFANRLSEVLCTRGTSCPSWCQGSCRDAVED